MSSENQRRRSRLWLLVPLALALAACRQDMHDQPRYEPLEASDFFADGKGSRTPPAFTVARGQLNADVAFFTGYHADGTVVAELPMTLDRELLERGRERFEIYCSPCHDRTGSGRGMIVERGFKQPPSYHEQRLREMPIGYFFDVATNGYGQMSGYKAQTKPADRWAIAAWVRVLQRSQHAPVETLTPADRERLLADVSGEDHADQDHADQDNAEEQGDDAGHGAGAP